MRKMCNFAKRKTESLLVVCIDYFNGNIGKKKVKDCFSGFTQKKEIV